jgi:hypothetical protein
VAAFQRGLNEGGFNGRQERDGRIPLRGRAIWSAPRVSSRSRTLVCGRAQLAILGSTPYVNYTGKLH